MKGREARGGDMLMTVASLVLIFEKNTFDMKDFCGGKWDRKVKPLETPETFPGKMEGGKKHSVYLVKGCMYCRRVG